MTAILMPEVPFTPLDAWHLVAEENKSKEFTKGEYFVSLEFIRSVGIYDTIVNSLSNGDRNSLYQLLWEFADKNEREIVGKLFTSCHPMQVVLLDSGFLLTNK